MLPPPSDSQPPEAPRRLSEASGLERFALGIPLERLTARALLELHDRWIKAPEMSPFVHLNYEANVRVRWNMHTNALEGSRVSHRDTARIVINRESVAGYSLQEVNEVAGHDRALQRVKQHARTGNRLRPEDLKAWQSLLLGPEPEPLRDPSGTLYPVAVGEWKSGANVIGLGGGRSRRTAAPEDVPQLVDEFLHRLHVDMDHVLAGRKDLLDVLADTHSRFIEIHPFDDGNGRTGRLVTSWQCLRVGVPVIIIPVKHGDLYREALNIAAETGNMRSLRTLLAAGLVHEMDFALAVSEGRADPTLSNQEADPHRPVQPRGAGYTGHGP